MRCGGNLAGGHGGYSNDGSDDPPRKKKTKKEEGMDIFLDALTMLFMLVAIPAIIYLVPIIAKLVESFKN